MSVKENKKILELIKGGNPTKCLNDLYKKEFPKIKKYILQNSGNEDDAKDVFQEAIMTLFTHVKLNKFKEEYEIGAFLFVVGRNNWKKRSGKKLETITLETDQISIHENYTYEVMFSKDRKKAIDQLFQSLGEVCQQLLNLVIFERKSMKEISDSLALGTAETIKVRYHRCKQSLGKLVNKNPDLKTQLIELLRS